MKYKINDRIKTNVYDNDVVKYLLYNQGIDNVDEYVNSNTLYDSNLLFNAQNGVELLNKHIDKNSKIGIIVDADCDGYTSASIMYQFLKNKVDNIVYYIHEGKQHGLYSQNVQWAVDNNLDLLIVPDAQCDIGYCKTLKDDGIDILILDHHETLEVNKYATIINPNYVLDTTYPNKDLSGCAVTWKFLQLCGANETFCIDLVACSLVADGMSFKGLENKYIVSQGLKKYYITNKFLLAMINAQSFSLGDRELIPEDIGWTIAPSINAMIRIGEMEDKNILFRALCELDEYFDYKKRGSTEVTQEDIYTRASRLCKNAHARQSKIRDKDFNAVKKIVEEKGLNNHKVIIATYNDINKNLTGLTAIKIANEFNKPTLLVHENNDKVSGSGRNFDNSYIEDFKGELNQSGLVEYADGHAFAFGTKINKDNIDKLVQFIDDKYKEVEDSKFYVVDEIIDEIDVSIIEELEKYKSWVVNDIKKPLFITNLEINTNNYEVIGKSLNTWRGKYNDEIEVIKFICSSDDFILNKINNMDSCIIKIEACVELKMNFFNGILKPQIVIQDYNIISCEDIDNSEDDDWDSDDDW